MCRNIPITISFIRIMSDYRSLTVEEIGQLEQNGCSAEDWTRVNVAEDFSPEYVYDVAFYGDVFLGVFDKQLEIDEGFWRHSGLKQVVLRNVIIGDNCLIENIGCYISGYTIGEECYIANVGTMTTTEGATFGQGNVISVKNEAGDGNVILYDVLTSQMAAFMVAYEHDKEVWTQLKEMVYQYVEDHKPEQGTIGYRVKIVNTRELVNTIVGDDCEINGASRLSETTLVSIPEASTYVGHDVICDNCIVQAGASVIDGAKIDNCFVGEACHIGKGFSAESSLFFANSYMDNGESCAAFCGPFSVSHHKSTLLIGGQYSFYNAGSATNFSNHAYKLGPIHHGTLQRGSKTASGSHILWPAQIGAFSVCLGKIQNHPNTINLPFSYIIGTEGATFLVPGRNLCTVGTYRDIAKWPKRDIRPRSGRQSIICFDWLSPYVLREVLQGKRILENLRAEQGANMASYTYNGCTIKNAWLIKGIHLYELAIQLYLGMAIKGHFCELPESSIGTGEWTDLAGLLTPETEVEQLAEDIRQGTLDELQLIDDRFIRLNEKYEDYKWNWTYRTLIDRLNIDSLTEDDIHVIEEDYNRAYAEWIQTIKHDAEKEFGMGDMEESILDDFLRKVDRQ